jgi:hypothetical protein
MLRIEDIRSKLAMAFPGTRFFVSRERFSGWAYKVRWIDGPEFEEVRAVADEMQTSGIAIRCLRGHACEDYRTAI